MNGTRAFGPFSSLGPETTVGLPVSLVLLFSIAVSVAVLVFPRASGESYATEIRTRLLSRCARRSVDGSGRVDARADPEFSQTSERLICE